MARRNKWKRYPLFSLCRAGVSTLAAKSAIGAKTEMLFDDPQKGTKDAEQPSHLRAMLTRVRTEREVVMINPYFVPQKKFIDELVRMSKSGVKVRVLTNSLASNDEPLVHIGYARYRPQLLRAGVDLYELSPTRVLLNKRLDLAIPGASLGRLHAKTAVIDRSITFIGSMNLDPRSDSTNTELGVIIHSAEFAREVLRVINISKLQSAYRLRFGPDGSSLQWLTTDDNGEVILYAEPDTTFMLRLQTMLYSPFVPEQEL